MSLILNGTNQRARSAATINLSADHAVWYSYWRWIDNNTIGQIPLEHSATGFGTVGGWANWLSASVANSDQYVYNPGTSEVLDSTPPSAGAWHQVMFGLDMSASPPTVAAFVDGAALGFGAQPAQGPTALLNDFLNVGARFDGTTASYWTAGRISQLAVWGKASGLPTLTDAQHIYNSGVASWALISGTSGGAPSFGWSLAADGTNSYGGIDLALTGSPTFGADPGSVGGGHNYLPIQVGASQYLTIQVG